MRCRKLERHLSKSRELTDALRGHLDNCPDCARLAEAESLLVTTLDAKREQVTDSATPLNVVRAQVEARLAARDKQETRLMDTVNQKINRRPRLTWGLAAAVAVLLFVTLVPFGYEVTVGYGVACTGMGAETAAYQPALTEALTALGYDASVSVSHNGDQVDYLITPLPTYQAAREAAAALTTITGANEGIEINPIIEEHSASLYAQVRDQIITVEVETDGKTDEEIAADIKAKLAEQGILSSTVNVTTQADGQRMIQIDMETEAQATGEQQMMFLGSKDGDAQFQLTDFSEGGLETIVAESEGLSDAELETLIEQKLAEKGLVGADVTVATDADGKRQIQINPGGDAAGASWNMKSE